MVPPDSYFGITGCSDDNIHRIAAAPQMRQQRLRPNGRSRKQGLIRPQIFQRGKDTQHRLGCRQLTQIERDHVFVRIGRPAGENHLSSTNAFS